MEVFIKVHIGTVTLTTTENENGMLMLFTVGRKEWKKKTPAVSHVAFFNSLKVCCLHLDENKLTAACHVEKIKTIHQVTTLHLSFLVIQVFKRHLLLANHKLMRGRVKAHLLL